MFTLQLEHLKGVGSRVQDELLVAALAKSDRFLHRRHLVC